MTDDALSTVSDTLAIQRVKAAYCAAADGAPADPHGAAARLAALFTDDITCDYAIAQMAGSAAVADWLVTSIGGGCKWMWHAIHTPLIDVAGDEAAAEWTVLVKRQGLDDPAPAEIVGRYRDRFRRTPDGWKIGAIQLVMVG